MADLKSEFWRHWRKWQGSKKPPKNEESTVIDAAALIAGILAVSASTIGAEGAFYPFDAAIGVTLLATVWGYTWEHKRNEWQSVAIATMMGLAATMIFGTLIDIYYCCDWSGKPSLLEDPWTTIVWLFASLVFFLLDQRRQEPQLLVVGPVPSKMG